MVDRLVIEQDPKSIPGKVFLVGAGPGDPGLLTVKAAALLRQADVVVLDRLVDTGILELIPPTAERVDVGKNAGSHPVPQERINQILVELARSRRQVIRLKGGDSFLFGRGGEELEALIANGIPFEVVPGVTSALAVPAYAGIPVTHRDYCSSVHVITGHKRSDQPLDLDYDALVRLNGTLVFLMSLANVGDIMEGLLNAGMPSDMPSAVIEHGTRPEQRKIVATIATLAAQVAELNFQSPALIVVGRVCSLSDKMDWFSQLPLKGVRILVTRPQAQAAAFVSRLRELGAAVTPIPSIETRDLPFELPNLSHYNTLVLTSVTGVHSFFNHLMAIGLDSRSVAGLKIAVIGSETAKALLTYGLKADFVPTIYNGGDLADQLLAQDQFEPGRLLIARARDSDPQLTDRLREAGIDFTEISLYETVRTAHVPIDPGDFDYVTFTSASCVTSFAQGVVAPCDLSRVTAVCIGQQTAKKAASYGMKIRISDQATTASMAELLCALVNEASQGG